MTDLQRGALGFAGGLVLGVLIMAFAWGVTYGAVYAPSYLEVGL